MALLRRKYQVANSTKTRAEEEKKIKKKRERKNI